ncbi:MAG TPA: MoaD/ThiS family protein [Candidatus Binataceae bacterium]|nr:MoaD/ThiS family protein [Candidatus Binataceae bacterium]
MATVIVPSLLRKLTGGRECVEVTAKNIREVVADLDRQFPGFAAHLLDNGDIKGSIAVSIDGEMGTGGVLDPVRPDSEIYFLPAIGGGR